MGTNACRTSLNRPDALTTFGVCVLLGTVLLLASIAFAQSIPNTERAAWRRTAAQGQALARIIASERSEVLRVGVRFDASELDLFASVVLNNRGSYSAAHGWLDVMSHLSPHVTMRRPPTRPRHEWTSTLVGCTAAQPSGWVSERDGNWNQYARQWQSLCLDIQDRWVRGEFVITPGVIAWGNIDDAKRHLCKRSSRNLCPVAMFVGANDRANVWFARNGDDVCSASLRAAFVEDHCEKK